MAWRALLLLVCAQSCYGDVGPSGAYDSYRFQGDHGCVGPMGAYDSDCGLFHLHAKRLGRGSLYPVYSWAPWFFSAPNALVSRPSPILYFLDGDATVLWWEELPPLRLFWHARRRWQYLAALLSICQYAWVYGLRNLTFAECFALHCASASSVGCGSCIHLTFLFLGYAMVSTGMHFPPLLCRVLSCAVIAGISVPACPAGEVFQLLLLAWYVPMYPETELTATQARSEHGAELLHGSLSRDANCSDWLRRMISVGDPAALLPPVALNHL